MLKKEYNLDELLPCTYRPRWTDWTEEDTTAYVLYLKKKYADNKEFVDFYNEVLADPEYVDRISHYYRSALEKAAEQYNRARLAKTGTTAKTDVEERSEFIAEMSEFIAEIMTLGLSALRMSFILMSVLLVFSGIGAGISAIFYYGEHGPLIAISLLLLFVIIMSFIKEWLDGKINEWLDGW